MRGLFYLSLAPSSASLSVMYAWRSGNMVPAERGNRGEVEALEPMFLAPIQREASRRICERGPSEESERWRQVIG